MNDTADLDGDPRTDRYVEITDTFGTIHGINFVGQAGLDRYGLTRVRFTRDLKAGETFSSAPATVIGGMTLDVDGNGRKEPLTDGLLTMRGLFGFEAAALTNGAVGVGARRVSGRDLGLFVQNGRDTLAFDIDADDHVEPLTDGLLMLRWLFGFRGDQLTQGAVGPRARRTSAADISTFLTVLTR